MLVHEENELLTRTGPGTPMGNLMRRYWVPVLLSRQLPEPDCPPVRVKVLGEELVAFRDSTGRVGLLDGHCAHRGASLFFGRNEECGLRCVYHGWKYDLTGQCVDMPNEPAESNFKDKIKLKAYPCGERGDLVWAYMGPPELQPGLPELEWTVVPSSHRYVSRRWQESNWFQGLEGGFDPTHPAFLHRGDNYLTLRGLPTEQARIRVPSKTEVVPGDAGLMLANVQSTDGDLSEWTVELWVLPFHKLIRGFGTKLIPGFSDVPRGTHMWVPIDDENCMVHTIDYHPDRPLTDEERAFSSSGKWLHGELLPGSDRPVLNKSNDYLIDRELQRSGKSFTGIKGIGMQDTAIQQSMGPIYDRTREHLGASDRMIIAIRRYLLNLLQEVEKGATPPGLDPASHRVRSALFTAPKELSFQEAVGDHLRARSEAYATLDGKIMAVPAVPLVQKRPVVR